MGAQTADQLGGVCFVFAMATVIHFFKTFLGEFLILKNRVFLSVHMSAGACQARRG